MTFSKFANNLLALIILFLFFFLIYTKMKNQTLKETWTQVKEMISGENG